MRWIALAITLFAMTAPAFAKGPCCDARPNAVAPTAVAFTNGDAAVSAWMVEDAVAATEVVNAAKVANAAKSMPDQSVDVVATPAPQQGPCPCCPPGVGCDDCQTRCGSAMGVAVLPGTDACCVVNGQAVLMHPCALPGSLALGCDVPPPMVLA